MQLTMLPALPCHKLENDQISSNILTLEALWQKDWHGKALGVPSLPEQPMEWQWHWSSMRSQMKREAGLVSAIGEVPPSSRLMQ